MVRGDNSLFFSTALDNSGLKKGSFDAAAIVTGLANKISKINPFAALAIGAGAAFALIGKQAFDFAADYEQAMLEVKTISKAAQADFKGINVDIFKLSKETLDDPIQLAKAYYQIVSAGYDGTKGLRLLEVASKAATGGVTDTLTAADGITTILNAFGESAGNADKVADAMFKTVELGKTTFSELSANMSTAAPLASSLGVSYNEILASVASLTKQGVPTAQAMTQIRAALLGLNKELGDGWSKTRTFQEALAEVEKRSGGSTTKLQIMVGSVEAVGAILATTGKNAKGAAQDLKDLEDASGSADKAFRTMAVGQHNSLAILRNRLRAITESLGGDLLDAANSVSAALLKMSDGASFDEGLYKKERIELAALRAELERGGVAQERKIEIIDELKEKYPAFLKNIKNEGKYTKEIESALIGVNEQIVKRLRIAANSGAILDADTDRAETIVAFKKQEGKLQREIDALYKGSEYHRRAIDKNASRSFQDQVEAIHKLDSDKSRLVEFEYRTLRVLGKEKLAAQRLYNELLGKEKDAKEGLVSFDVPTPGDGDGDDKAEATDLTPFEKELKAKAALYEKYQIAIGVYGQEAADKLYKKQLGEHKTYADFLHSQLALTKDFSKKMAIATAAENYGIGSFLKKKKVQKLEIEIHPQVKIDISKSEETITRVIAVLKRKRSKAETRAERESFDDQIALQEAKLKLLVEGTDEEIALQKIVSSTVEDLTIKQLKVYIDYWKKRKKATKEGSKEEELAAKNIGEGQDEKLNRTTDFVLKNLSEIGDAFRSFGDDTTADLIDGVVAVGDAFLKVNQQIKDEMSKGDGLVQTASSVTNLVSLVVGSARKRKAAEEEYYLSVINFQKQYNQLLNEQLGIQASVNENVFTTDFIKEMENGLEQLADANASYQESIDALDDGSVKAGQRNKIDGLAVTAGVISGAFAAVGIGAAIGAAAGPIGIALGALIGGIVGLFSKKKKNLFTDLLGEYPELLQRTADGVIEVNEEIAQALLSNDLLGKKTKGLVQDTLDWADKIKEAREQINGVVSDLAGGLGDSLRDALVGAFEDGTDAAQVMGEEVSNVLQNVLEQLIFDQVFSAQFKTLQDEMAKSFDLGGDRSWMDDFSRFFEQSKLLTDEFNAALTDAQQAGNEFGFDLFNGDPTERQGIAGGIASITEDTANILAGTVNGIRVDVNIGLAVARESSEYLASISNNTGRMVEQLELSNIRLTAIEKNLV